MSGLQVNRLLTENRVIIFAGSGGVGKTTIAAALGVGGTLTNEPSRIDLSAPGELWATMLDTRTTFDALIHRYSPTPEQATRPL